MAQQSRVVGPNRYRETFGRYFENFSVGDTWIDP